MLNATADEGQELDRNFKERKIAKQQELKEEWGKNSSQTKNISDQISTVCNIVNNRVDQMFRFTSPIREEYISRIDAITTMEEVKELCRTLPSAIANEVAQHWDSIMRDAINETSAILNNAMSDIDRFALDGNNANGISTLELTTSQKLGNVRNILGTGLMATSVAIFLCPPIAPVVAVGAALWAWIAGKNDEVLRNKNNLKAELNKILDRISHTLKDARSHNQPSIVGEFIGNLKQNVERVLQESVDTKKREMEKQLEDLEEQARKDIGQKRVECESLKSELAELNKLVQTTNSLVTLRESLEKQIS